jgi:hypothetical protein
MDIRASAFVKLLFDDPDDGDDGGLPPGTPPTSACLEAQGSISADRDTQ